MRSRGRHSPPNRQSFMGPRCHDEEVAVAQSPHVVGVSERFGSREPELAPEHQEGARLDSRPEAASPRFQRSTRRLGPRNAPCRRPTRRLLSEDRHRRAYGPPGPALPASGNARSPAGGAFPGAGGVSRPGKRTPPVSPEAPPPAETTFSVTKPAFFSKRNAISSAKIRTRPKDGRFRAGKPPQYKLRPIPPPEIGLS